MSTSDIGCFSFNIQYSEDDGNAFHPVTSIDLCRKCKERTIICPHRQPREQIIKIPTATTDLKVVALESDIDMRDSSNGQNARASKVLENVKFTVLEALTNMEELWDQMGIKEENKEQRTNTISEHVTDLLNEMLADESELKSKMELKSEEYKKEVQQLCSDLKIAVKELPQNLTLVEMENRLRNEADTLNKEKYDRLKCLRRLRAEEQLLCDLLLMPQHELNFTGCPSLQMLRELEHNVVMLKNEKASRAASVSNLKREISELWKEMDIKPQSDFEEKISDPSDTSIVLSTNTIDSLKKIKLSLESERTQLSKEIKQKREQFKVLWGRLQNDVVKSVEVDFNKIPPKNTRTALNLLNQNLVKVNELKMRHLGKFIIAIRSELAVLWEKCYTGEEQRMNFQPYFDQVFTEESLAEHEHQLNSVKRYYEENKELLDLVSTRETLWAEKMKRENQPKDGARFNTRGGALLQELKKGQYIEKKLPKIEKQIINKINRWEKKNESAFVYRDARYLEHMALQKHEHEMDQQTKKEEKQRVKAENASREIAYGSNPKSAKRKMGTPNSANKFSRMDSTLRIGKSPRPNKIRVLTNKCAVNGKTDQSNGSKFTHSSLSIPSSPHGKSIKAQKENHVPRAGVRKVPPGKAVLMTESRKKRTQRRSIRSTNIKEQGVKLQNKFDDCNPTELLNLTSSRILKGKSEKIVGDCINSTNLNDLVHEKKIDVSIISYDDFSNAVAEGTFSRSSFIGNRCEQEIPFTEK